MWWMEQEGRGRGLFLIVAAVCRCGQVFINQKFIGGGDDTVKLQKSGELQKMLSAQPTAA